jgi:hypothetical protein
MFGYDEHGFPNDIRFQGQTTWRSTFKSDDRGNILEETVVGSDGKPAPGSEGWAIHRHKWEFSANGYREDETWFSADGGIAFAKDGQHRRISEFDSSGNLFRLTTEQHDPARYSYQRWVWEPDFDAQGRERHNIIRYQDANGQPATGADLGFTTQETTLDEEGREILQWKLGCSPEVGAPVLRIDTEWHRTGIQKKIVRQACDENRNPVKTLSNGTAARAQQEFTELGQLQRIQETGFDESVVGYSSREVMFESGKLLNVVHRRSDGTDVKSVAVRIKYVEPQQEKAKELHPGDQLVAANDVPVTSAYGWVFTPFDGGWIEVIRDGKRLRIEGFEAGQLGIILEDRATDLKSTPNGPSRTGN